MVSVALNQRQLACARAAQRDHVRAAVDAALAATTADVTALVRRDCYAAAVRTLIAIVRPIRPNHLVPMLLETCDATPGRVAAMFDAVKSVDDGPLVTLDTLAAIARRKGRRAENARTALAALGAPFHPWPDMGRRERAAYILGLVVQLRRAVS